MTLTPFANILYTMKLWPINKKRWTTEKVQSKSCSVRIMPWHLKKRYMNQTISHYLEVFSTRKKCCTDFLWSESLSNIRSRHWKVSTTRRGNKKEGRKAQRKQTAVPAVNQIRLLYTVPSTSCETTANCLDALWGPGRRTLLGAPGNKKWAHKTCKGR